MPSFLAKFKALLLSYPDLSYMDWKFAEMKKAIEENRTSPLLMQNILYRTEAGVSSEPVCDSELIVSLSTFGLRIHGVALTIETLMEQTVRPNRIILNLGHEFEGKGKIPGSLKLLEKRGLEIRFTKDVGPYTKLLPTLRDFPDATIITVDDDILYDYDLVSTLLNGHLNHPQAIIAPRCRIMEVEKGQLKLPFESWKFAETGTELSRRLLPEGVRGVLYPAGALDEHVFDEKTFMHLCPTTDDFWFKAMSLLKGTLVSKCYTDQERVNLINSKSDKSVLLHQINKNGGYDHQLKALSDHFKLTELL